MKENKTIKSQYNVILESKVIDNGSDTLAVVLPGIGYTLERPLLDYSTKLCKELGYDILGIEYGFQLSGEKFERENMNIIVDETYALLKMALNPKYKRIVFIGKSIGTVVQIFLLNKLIEEGYEFDFTNIYLTPVNSTVDLGIKKGALVFTGTSDPLINEENVEKIENVSQIELIKIDGADHSMNIENDIVRSSEILTYIIKKEKEYLINKI